MKTTIYRTGEMSVGTHDDETLEHWNAFDKRRPTGHVRRQDVMYASPDFAGSRRWFSRICVENIVENLNDETPTFNAITVESDNVRVYSVNIYNQVDSYFGSLFRQDIEKVAEYWASGITLTEWMETIGEDPEGAWEVLLPAEAVISSHVLSARSVKALQAKRSPAMAT